MYATADRPSYRICQNDVIKLENDKSEFDELEKAELIKGEYAYEYISIKW